MWCSGGLVFPKREYAIRRGPHVLSAVVSFAPYPPNPQSNHSIFRASSLVFSLCRKLPKLKLMGEGGWTQWEDSKSCGPLSINTIYFLFSCFSSYSTCVCFQSQPTALFPLLFTPISLPKRTDFIFLRKISLLLPIYSETILEPSLQISLHILYVNFLWCPALLMKGKWN
jgi:hypothetical protein